MTRSMWLCALVLLSAAPAGADEWQKSFPLTGRPMLHAETRDGSVRIDTWDRKEIGIRVVTQGWHLGQNSVHVEEHQDGNRVDLRVIEPHLLVSFVFSLRSIRVEIHVPREADLDVTTGDGSVNIRSVAGKLVLHSGDGMITADDVRGDLSLSTGDGSITVTRCDGRLMARTGDGRVRIDGRFDGLDLETGDGSVLAVAQAGSKLGEGWSLETGDGPVTLRIPTNLDAELDARSDDGGIHLDLPVKISGTYDHHEVHGQLNRGGAPLRVRTHDGSIHIGAL